MQTAIVDMRDRIKATLDDGVPVAVTSVSWHPNGRAYIKARHDGPSIPVKAIITDTGLHELAVA